MSRRKIQPQSNSGASLRPSEWFLPSYAQALALGFSLEKNGSAGVLDFVREDKTTLSYVRLHSEQQPGRFALLNGSELVFCGTVASEAAFPELLGQHNWQAPGTAKVKEPPAEKETEAPAEKEERPKPEPPHPTHWRPGAQAFLSLMSAEGQQAALASWAQIHKRAGGQFAPQLPAPLVVVKPAPVVLAPGLLDDFTVLDLEFQDDNLLELAAIRFQHWQPVNQFVSLVRYREPIRPIVTQVCGITGNQVWDAPEDKWVLQQFLKLAQGSLLVAHNALAADKRVLEAVRKRLGAPHELPNRWLCTMAVAKQYEREGLLPKGQKTNLTDLCKHYHIDSRGHHEALRDVEMCSEVLRCQHSQRPITELITSLAKPKKAGQMALFSAAA